MAETKKVRVSARMQQELYDGQTWIDIRNDNIKEADKKDPANINMHRKLIAAKKRKDGSVTVELTLDEANALYGYADVIFIGARDNVGSDPEWALPDLRMASALCNQLVKLFGPTVAAF
jgi:hypothetical protein